MGVGGVGSENLHVVVKDGKGLGKGGVGGAGTVKTSRSFPSVKVKGSQLGTWVEEGTALWVGRGLWMSLRAVVFCPWLRWLSHGHACTRREDMPPPSALWLRRVGSQRQTRLSLLSHAFVLPTTLRGCFSRRLTKTNWHHRSLE